MIEERELTRLLQQLGDRTTPSPPPLRRIVDEGEALRGRRHSARVRVFAMSAAAAAVIGGGAVAATVIQLPSGGNDSGSNAGQAAVDDGAGGGGDSAAESGRDTSGEEGEVADAAAPVTATPSVLAPGEAFSLTSPDPDAGFGLAWDLQRSVGGSLTTEYVLVAGSDDGAPRAFAAGESWAVTDVLVPAPLRFVLPPELDPGDYRLCEGGNPEVCAPLVVAG